MKYEDLYKHFTSPKKISPFYNFKKIPRKLKKELKKTYNIYWNLFDNNQKLWCYLGNVNPNYRSFLYKKICENNENIRL